MKNNVLKYFIWNLIFHKLNLSCHNKLLWLWFWVQMSHVGTSSFSGWRQCYINNARANLGEHLCQKPVLDIKRRRIGWKRICHWGVAASSSCCRCSINLDTRNSEGLNAHFWIPTTVLLNPSTHQSYTCVVPYANLTSLHPIIPAISSSSLLNSRLRRLTPPETHDLCQKTAQYWHLNTEHRADQDMLSQTWITHSFFYKPISCRRNCL